MLPPFEDASRAARALRTRADLRTFDAGIMVVLRVDGFMHVIHPNALAIAVLTGDDKLLARCLKARVASDRACAILVALSRGKLSEVAFMLRFGWALTPPVVAVAMRTQKPWLALLMLRTHPAVVREASEGSPLVFSACFHACCPSPEHMGEFVDLMRGTDIFDSFLPDAATLPSRILSPEVLQVVLSRGGADFSSAHVVGMMNRGISAPALDCVLNYTDHAREICAGVTLLDTITLTFGVGSEQVATAVSRHKMRRGRVRRAAGRLERSPDECCICLEGKDTMQVRPFQCRHVMHQACCEQMVTRGQAICPLCRST